MEITRNSLDWQLRLNQAIDPTPGVDRMNEFAHCFSLLVDCWQPGELHQRSHAGTIYAYEETAVDLMSRVRRGYVSHGLLRSHDMAVTDPDNKPYTTPGVGHGLSVMLRFMYQAAAHSGGQIGEAGELADILTTAQSRDALRSFAREARYTNQQLEHHYGLTHPTSDNRQIGRWALTARGIETVAYAERRQHIQDVLRAENRPDDHIESDPANYCQALRGGHWNRIYDDVVRLCLRDPELFQATLSSTSGTIGSNE